MKTAPLIGVLILLLICMADVHAQCGERIQWFEQLGEIESGDGSPDFKITLLQKLLKRIDQCYPVRDSLHARVIHRLGDLYRLDGDFESAISLTVEAVTINKRPGKFAEPAYLTHSYYNLALFHALLNVPAKAFRYYDSCIETGMRFRAKQFIVMMALEKKAFLYFKSGDYEQSIQTAHMGVVQAREHDDPKWIALLLIQMAQSQIELGKLSEAGDNINESLLLLKTHELDRYLANAYSVYASLLRKQGDLSNALAYYKKALKLNLEQGNIRQAVRDHQDLAFLYDEELHNTREAVRHYNEGIRLVSGDNDAFTLATLYNNLGLVYGGANDHVRALEYYQQALRALVETHASSDVKVDPEVATLKKIANPYIAAALMWNKGDSWLGRFHQTGDPDLLKLAMRAYRAGDKLVDHMRWQQDGDVSRLFWRQKTKQWYEKAVEACYLANDPGSAFHFMEKSRAVLLNDKLSELGANRLLPDSLQHRESILRRRITDLLQEGSTVDEYQRSEAVWRARRQLDRFMETLEAAYPSYYRYKYDTTVVTLADVQRGLKAETLVEVFSYDQGMYILTVSEKQSGLHKIEYPHHQGVASSIMQWCADKGALNVRFNEFREVAHQYFRRVIEPLRLEPGQLIVSWDDYFLPLDVLPMSLTDDSYMIDRYAIGYCYSATHQLKYMSREQQVFSRMLALSPITYQDDLKQQTLYGAGESLRKIKGYFSGAVIRTDHAATKQWFLENIGNYDVVHVYSHAEADSTEKEPLIYLHDAALPLSELATTSGKTKLALLFACNTGTGKHVKGEGVLSLARGFAASGIPSTVSSLWNIESHSSFILAEYFYFYFRQGMSADLALWKAKLALKTHEGERYALPYYWAGHILIGPATAYSFEDEFTGVASWGNVIQALLGLCLASALLFALAFFTRLAPAHSRQGKPSVDH